jgi:hypothetical protein
VLAEGDEPVLLPGYAQTDDLPGVNAGLAERFAEGAFQGFDPDAGLLFALAGLEAFDHAVGAEAAAPDSAFEIDEQGLGSLCS